LILIQISVEIAVNIVFIVSKIFPFLFYKGETAQANEDI